MRAIIEAQGEIPERRLWIAVLTQAVVEWQSDNLRRSKAAEAFLLRDHEDFSVVCNAAGFEASQFRANLERVSRRSSQPLSAPRNAGKPASTD